MKRILIAEENEGPLADLLADVVSLDGYETTALGIDRQGRPSSSRIRECYERWSSASVAPG